ncbi:uncharacterized protein LOC62_06G008124 [Vanrija pseudolonga]|uniref:Uncharacterized protein n=1 Tax=Vanrija pseudolonga TaxID=143232 RepID=A0AAF0YD91_9TREE|nr:hypothetical protein LOC62_06G008124 [Vanrija pseudolonga]
MSSTEPAEPDAAAAARADARALRIAKAVERSKTEYKPEHAYTERGWFNAAGPSDPAKAKADRQKVEYIATRALVVDRDRVSAAAALAAVRAAAGAKALSGLPRELLGTALAAAVAARDDAACVEFAAAAKGHWGTNVGLALASAQALSAGGKTRDSLAPLLASTGVALHYPILEALRSALEAEVAGEGGDDGVETLTQVVRTVAASRAWAFARPLFAEGKPAQSPAQPAVAEDLRERIAAVDRQALAKRLAVERGVLDGAVARLARALGSAVHEEPEAAPGERVERGVREL